MIEAELFGYADSSEDESPRSTSKAMIKPVASTSSTQKNSDIDVTEYKDIWGQNSQDNSDEIAKKTFMELQQHKAQIEAIKAKVMDYSMKNETIRDSVKKDSEKEPDVNDLLALGEEVPKSAPTKKKKTKRVKDDSESELEEWEEVKETAAIPQQGLQLFVDFPDAACRKSKKLDVEMMMKRKINRVKKEYQVYMHKVHVLCWIGHGNYVSQVLNDQDILASALSMIPSKECYPGERVDMKYVEQITKWYNDKLILNQDKNENKFRPKASPLKDILLTQMKKKVVTTKKNMVFIFVSMLRALGLQCRVMFNFVTLPIKPPKSELCSLSVKAKEEKDLADKSATKQEAKCRKACPKKPVKSKGSKIPQLDGIFDYSTDSEFENFMQVDGNDDALSLNTRSIRSTRKTNAKTEKASDLSEDDKIPVKKARKSPNPKVSKSSDSKTISMKIASESANKTVCENNLEKPVSPKNIPRKNPRNTKDSKSNTIEKDSPKSQDKTKRVCNSSSKSASNLIVKREKTSPRFLSLTRCRDNPDINKESTEKKEYIKPVVSPRKTRSNIDNKKTVTAPKTTSEAIENKNEVKPPEIIISKTEEHETSISSKYFDGNISSNNTKRLSLSRKRSQTSNPAASKPADPISKEKSKSRTKSAPGTSLEKSKYFTDSDEVKAKKPRVSLRQQTKNNELLEDLQRVSHKDLVRSKTKPNNDVTGDLVNIIKKRVQEAKVEAQQGIVKGKRKEDSDDDSDFLPVESPKRRHSESDDDFKPSKISPKPSTSKKIDRRVLSSDDDLPKNKIDVWCEVFVEELEQWIAVDIIRGKVHCATEIYNRATHPVCYIVGWDNSNYLKDLTRRYVPHWNTVTRKQRAESLWWDQAIKSYLGPKTARDREEDEGLDRMQLEAPLPKSISEYKNHPLYALKRHLLKFEAIYPPDAATLGFVRGEAVYARDCVYTCRSRDTWLKEAKVVRLGEKPYKLVKAWPKWDKLSNKMITDRGFTEVFGQWQVMDFEPPVAEHGIVPRNAYGNVELFKQCMLPKGTVHIKLPGLNRVAKKLNIDCAPAMTGFDFNGGWSHPVYDGFVVCQEFEELVTEAWVKDQEEQLRREREKIDLRVYGNWKRLIKGLLIKERLKNKYGFKEPSTSQDKKKQAKKPRLVVKK